MKLTFVIQAFDGDKLIIDRTEIATNDDHAVRDVGLTIDAKLKEWLRDQKWFWTEQYLLQAFLAFNHDYEVLLALAYLSEHHHDALCRACPVYATEPGRVPGSFWMRRVDAGSAPRDGGHQA